MNIIVLGATGRVGSRILAEALQRGHRVNAVARDADRLAALDLQAPHAGRWQASTTDPEALARLLAGHDVVISATRFGSTDPQDLIAAVRRAGVPRLLVAGGAGSLEVAPGQALVDTADFAPAHRDEALAGRRFLQALRAAEGLPWTFLSPSALLTAGERTGKFRLGGDQLLRDADGKSAISFEDFAVALLDEVEQPAHLNRRFTVGY